MSEELTQELITAGITAGSFLFIILLIQLSWKKIVHPFVSKTRTDLDDVVIHPLKGLVIWGLVLAAAYYTSHAISWISSRESISNLIGKGLSVGWVVLAVMTVIRIVNGVIAWHTDKETEEDPDKNHQSGILQKLTTALIAAFGLLYILKIANVDISPLLASGAVGGLVIGLALQDTLSNIFAGVFINIDRPIRLGDLIQLESGEEGFVEEIGWRYTKIRLWANTLMLIPNNKLSQSTIINFELPNLETSVYIYGGVAYDTDLEHAEKVLQETAETIQAEIEGASKNWSPTIRWKEFGDSSINFYVVLRVTDPQAQYRIRSEAIKMVHRRFGEENIEIPFPMRTLTFKDSPKALLEDLQTKN